MGECLPLDMLYINTLHSSPKFINIKIMFTDYFKLRTAACELVAINEALRPYVPDYVAIRIKTLINVVSDVADNLKDK